MSLMTWLFRRSKARQTEIAEMEVAIINEQADAHSAELRLWAALAVAGRQLEGSLRDFGIRLNGKGSP